MVPAVQDDAPRNGAVEGGVGRQGPHNQGGCGQARANCRTVWHTVSANLHAVPQRPHALEAKRHDAEGRFAVSDNQSSITFTPSSMFT